MYRRNTSEEPGGSLLRVRKFLARGYTIDVPSLAMLVHDLVEAAGENSLSAIESRLLAVDPNVSIEGIEAELVEDQAGRGE